MPPPLFSFRAYRVVVVVVIAIYYPLRYKNMITSNASSRPTAPISAALTPGVSATPRILGSLPLPLRPASTAHGVRREPTPTPPRRARLRTDDGARLGLGFVHHHSLARRQCLDALLNEARKLLERLSALRDGL